MAEAIGIAGSVVGIVGFAGQVLQGCQIVSSFFDDLREAPAYIEDLRTILQAFQANLTSLTSKVRNTEAVDEDLRLALEYSGKCIRNLQVVVDNLQSVGSGRRIGFAFVRWKTKIMKEVENIRMAMALLNGAQMNQVGNTLENVYSQVVQSQIDSQGWYALVKQTERMSLIPAPSWRQSRKRRPTRPTSGGPNSLASSKNAMIRPERLPIEMEESQKTRAPALKGNETLKSVKGVLSASNSSMLTDFPNDQHFNFGSCNYLPSDYVEAVKDTIRGVLVEYYFQKRGHPAFESVSNIFSSASTTMQKHKAKVQTRGILGREFEEQQYHRTLGLVTITCITTKWRTSHLDNSHYLETRIQVYLDPTSQDSPARFRLFCISNFDGTPRYEGKIRSSTQVACRDGDLDKVRMLFASGAASPYDCCEADTNITLLDIVFKQLILNMDAPKGRLNLMPKLHMMFKYLVDVGLDPGELQIQHRHMSPSTAVKGADLGFYDHRCSHCFEIIDGMYYDCKLCTSGDFSLCQPCLDAGRRCQDLGHHEKQPLVYHDSGRKMLCYSPIESLASIYYVKDNAPHLVDVARTILCCSKQDPFQNDHGRLLEWRWYEEITNLESSVLDLISKQQEWVFQWDEIKPTDPSTIPLTWKPEDPVQVLLRAWSDIFQGHSFWTPAYGYGVAKQLDHLLDSDEVHTEFCIRAAPIIDDNEWCIPLLLWARYLWELRRPSLEDLLSRCTATRHIKGYRRIASKYCPAEGTPISFRLRIYERTNSGAYSYNITFLTRNITKGRETKSEDGDMMGVCLLSRQSSRAEIFYEGAFGAFWFEIIEQP